jgi:hypothetical protein
MFRSHHETYIAKKSARCHHRGSHLTWHLPPPPETSFFLFPRRVARDGASASIPSRGASPAADVTQKPHPGWVPSSKMTDVLGGRAGPEIAKAWGLGPTTNERVARAHTVHANPTRRRVPPVPAPVPYRCLPHPRGASSPASLSRENLTAVSAHGQWASSTTRKGPDRTRPPAHNGSARTRAGQTAMAWWVVPQLTWRWGGSARERRRKARPGSHAHGMARVRNAYARRRQGTEWWRGGGGRWLLIVPDLTVVDKTGGQAVSERQPDMDLRSWNHESNGARRAWAGQDGVRGGHVG